MSNSIRIAEGGLLVAILAAGKASRFGGGKLDRMCAGQRVGSWAIDASEAAGLPRGIIVTPPRAPAFASEAQGWTCLANAKPEQGMGSSVAVAAQAALDARANALLILLADMPLVDPDFLAMLVAANCPAATRYAGNRPGVPALIPATMFAAAARLTGDRGLAPLLAGSMEATLIDPPPGMLLDIDVESDLAEAEDLLAQRQAP